MQKNKSNQIKLDLMIYGKLNENYIEEERLTSLR